MDLKDKKCILSKRYAVPFSMDEKQKYLQFVDNNWQLTHNESRILRKFKFNNFKRALEFAQEVGRISEEENHHPEIHLGWGHCDIEIWTHTHNDLFENDFILAAKIDELFRKLFPSV